MFPFPVHHPILFLRPPRKFYVFQGMVWGGLEGDIQGIVRRKYPHTEGLLTDFLKIFIVAQVQARFVDIVGAKVVGVWHWWMKVMRERRRFEWSLPNDLSCREILRTLNLLFLRYYLLFTSVGFIGLQGTLLTLASGLNPVRGVIDDWWADSTQGFRPRVNELSTWQRNGYRRYCIDRRFTVPSF